MNSISVIIPTRRRAASLKVTLDEVTAADRSGVDLDVVVVDNVGDEQSRGVVEAAGSRGLQTRYLVERREGKSFCLNCALEAGGLAEIVAVLDDDMSVHRDWVQGVLAITRRWPDKGFYSGRSYVIWPEGVEVPTWASHPSLSGWAYSVAGPKAGDVLVEAGNWVSGNHFWVQRKHLEGRRFHLPADIALATHIEMSEPRLMMDLTDAGLGGVMGADAVVGHRIQPELLSLELLRVRAARVGRGFCEAKLRPCRPCSTLAQLFKRRPTARRLFSSFSIIRWAAERRLARLRWDETSRVPREFQAIMREAFYREALRVTARMEEYGGRSRRDEG